MEIRPIRTENDYQAALEEISRLMDAPDDDRAADDRLEIMAALVKVYEDARYPIAPPSPVALLRFVMEERGLTRRDLARAIGSEARVSSVLRGRRTLSLSMIVRLNKLFGIPVAGLIDRRIKPKPRGHSGARVKRAAAARRTAKRR